MLTNQEVSPSNLADSFLPNHIKTSYLRFVEFMSTSLQSQERTGFTSDLLQGLLQYRDFDNYNQNPVEQNYLARGVDQFETEIELKSTVGFPKTDGVILIDEEII